MNTGNGSDSKLFARWRKANRAGTSAVEFAIVAPIFVALLASTIETGHVFLVQSELTATAHEAVRRLATDVMPEADTAAFVQNQLPGIPANAMTVNVASTLLASGRTDLTVQLSVPVANVALLNLTDLFPNNLVLDASATMVKE